MSKIIIIGGGVSGLSAGIYAAINSHNVLIYEKQHEAGGNLTGWQRGDYHIDNCIHWLTGTNPNTEAYKTWCDLGVLGDVDILQSETLYTCEKYRQRLSLSRDIKKLEKDMLAVSPKDEKEIRDFIGAIKAIQGFCKIAGEAHNEELSAEKKALSLPLLAKYYTMSAKDLSLRFSHPLLRLFISSFLDEHFSSLALILICATFCGENGGIPRGGSRAMAERMVSRFKSLGGTLVNSKEAVRINYDGNRAYSVTFSDGSEDFADYFILSCDVKQAFVKLLGKPLPRRFARLYQNPKYKLFSSIHCAFSLDMDESEIPFREDFIFEVPEKHRAFLSSSKIILREFSREKSYFPEGKNVLQVMLFCDEKRSRKIIEQRENDFESYKKFKEAFASVSFEIIVQRFPQMREKITLLDVWTPATYKRFTSCWSGSYMSFALPKATVPHRMSGSIDGLSNAILATQYQQLPGGLPIAAKSGYLAAKAIEQKETRRQKFSKNHSLTKAKKSYTSY